MALTVETLLALGLQLLAVVELVFGGIGERGRHAVAHAGAAGEPGASREQRRRGGGARQCPALENANDHAPLAKPTILRLRKAAARDRIEALPEAACPKYCMDA